jgi:signal transduction histidine kinase
VAAGGTRTADGRLWFPTSQGLAVLNPIAPQEPQTAPAIHLLDVSVDGKAVDYSRAARLQPGSARVQIRYTAIHLTAPERVQYSHKLEGLDADWVAAGRRREINYNSLGYGKYRFLARAEIPGGLHTEAAYDFEVLPRFYETTWFRLLAVLTLCAGAWGGYQLRVRQLRYRFALMLQERARLAREIHDTLAQSFVGISSQLEAVVSELPAGQSAARLHLDMARKMARHSITEARRSILDLRSSVLEGQNLADALRSGAQVWTAGSRVTVEVEAFTEDASLPDEVEQHLLRIAQEAVSNVLKHAKAGRIWIKLDAGAETVSLTVRDDGQGFELRDTFSPSEGHFGLIGMRERAERLGGEFRLTSELGQGTCVEVTVPLS